MTVEDRIRLAAHGKFRVYITSRKRSASGFTVVGTDGTKTTVPSKRIALEFLRAIVRCQPVRAFTLKPAGAGVRMIAEFARVVTQSRPVWFLLENVPNVPHIVVDGYEVQRIYASAHEFGMRQRRERVFQFGHRPGDDELVLLRRILSRPGPWAKTITTKHTHRNFADLCALQGLPRAFTVSGLSRSQKIRAVANGVPVPMAAAVAEAIRDRAVRSHWLAVCGLTKCACGCGRVCDPRLWGQRAGGVACRKRIERSRRGVTNGRVTWP